jgi:3-deoxy-D-manno-octulosonate 8-phosphate phosphatase (KDO 8-P phosphatase)
MKLSIENIEAFVFDFDGVLTNNFVLVDQDGKESVMCNRSDGLAFDVLNKIKKPVYLISTETNAVVKERAKKLRVPVFNSTSNKSEVLNELARLENFSLENIVYIGNDINDFEAMQLCGLKVCPSDSHKKIKSIASIVLESRGGEGVARELLEEVIGLDFIKILYNS